MNASSDYLASNTAIQAFLEDVYKVKADIVAPALIAYLMTKGLLIVSEDVLIKHEDARERMIIALAAITPPIPAIDARCHDGICTQEECGNCQRIINAHKVINNPRK